MDITPTVTLEAALAKTEADAQKAVKAAQAALASTKRIAKAARDGNVKDLRTALDGVAKVLNDLGEQCAVARSGWKFDEEDYLAGRGYVDELLATARTAGLDLTERDERLYCYPLLVRVRAKERSLQIDRKQERRLRPSVVVAHLKEIQKRPPRFSADAFLESLYGAWQRLIRQKPTEGGMITVPLIEVYNLLTLLPGQAREYTRQEFTRDIYLLEKVGRLVTKDGMRANLSGDTGTKIARAALIVVREDGSTKPYFGLGFTRA